MAFAPFGVITPVLSVVLSVFMAGLFVGTWGAGRWIDTLTRKTGFPALGFYALAEAVVALGAFAVPRLFALGEAALLDSGAFDSTAYLLRSALVIAGSLFIWCVAMGATLPCILAHLRRDGRSDGSGFSFLYLANVLGAMLGVLLTALVLIEALGLHGTLYLASAVNGLVALAAGIMALNLEPIPAPSGPLPRPESPPRAASGSAGSNGLLFMTGFTSMAMEVVWTRAFTPILLTQVYSFALILFTYLLATLLGSMLYRRHRVLGKTAATHELLAWLTLSAVLPLALNDPSFGLGVAGALFSIFPFCLGLGYLTPKLVDQVSQGIPEFAGWSYAMNILGSCLGPLAASYLLLPGLGVRASLVLLALPFWACWAACLDRRGPRLRPWILGGVGFLFLALCLGGFKTYEEPGGGLGQGPEESAGAVRGPRVVKRDSTATTVALGEGMNKLLLVNGIQITHMTTITKVMAHLPAAFVPLSPTSGLVICLGMGTTFRSLATWGMSTTAVELAPSVRDQLGFFFSDAAALLATPGDRVVIDDGRRFLKRGRDRFDVITVDPPPPLEAAASSLLYSREFYGLVRSRLKPQGVFQQWVPETDPRTLGAIVASLLNSFPYVRMFRSHEGWGYHFLASLEPLPARGPQELARRMPPAAQRDLVEWLPGVTPQRLFQVILSHEIDPRTVAAAPDKGVTDDRPYNEYYLLRTLFPTWAPYLH